LCRPYNGKLSSTVDNATERCRGINLAHMKFPQRSETHITETVSWRLLQELAPNEWIVREVSERDYGIDAYVEITTSAGVVTGELVSIQLKGTDRIQWKEADDPIQAMSPPIKTSTAAYWLSLPVPVFLFVADIATRNIHFTSVEPFIRANFDKLSQQETMTFKLHKDLNLRSGSGLRLFKWFSARERLHPHFVFHITNLLSSIDIFGDFIIYNQNYDFFMEVDDDRHLQLRTLYDCCQTASLYLEHEWTIEPLLELYKRDREEWKSEYAFLHEKTMDYILRKLQIIFPRLVRKALKLVSETQANYWRHKDFVFYHLCSSGIVEQSINLFEQKCGPNTPS
jgi:hypothetical protein